MAKINRAKLASNSSPVRSVRIDSPTWDKARQRARTEGVTMSFVMSALVDMFSKGIVDLPRTQIVYPKRVTTGQETPVE